MVTAVKIRLPWVRRARLDQALRANVALRTELEDWRSGLTIHRKHADETQRAQEQHARALRALTAAGVVTGEDAYIIQHELSHGTPDTPGRIAIIRDADRIYREVESRRQKPAAPPRKPPKIPARTTKPVRGKKGR